MKKNNISFDFQNKVRKYVDSIYDINNNNSINEHKVIDKLSMSLKEELLLRANRKILDKFLFFKENFCEETLKKIALAFKYESYLPEEIIIAVYFTRNKLIIYNLLK